MNQSSILLCGSLILIGCGGPASNSATDANLPSTDGATRGCPANGSLALKLTTDDDVELIADLYPSANPSGGPAVVLLHMIPPSNSKANFPISFAETFQARGFTVINVNRRGAPGSGGKASDAYTGPLGKLDAKAAYDYIKSECEIGSYALIGASNGTTTVIDFAVHAAETDGIDVPTSFIALSGGSYTESQNTIASKMSVLPTSGFLAYPSGESAWNEGIKAIIPNWQFVEYALGSHGTRLLTSNPEIVDVLLNFLDPMLR